MLEGRKLGFFESPVYAGECKNYDICEEICALAAKHEEQTKNLRLISDGWNAQTRTDDKELREKHGVTSHGTNDQLHLLEEWERPTNLIIGMAKELLKHADQEHWYSSRAAIESMWYSMYPEGGYIPEHIHSNVAYSGVFYAKAEHDAGNLVFQDPAWHLKSAVWVNDAPAQAQAITKRQFPVYTGVMFVFPGWLPHSTMPNNSGEDRVIVGFNLSF
tara:strand:- start:318 stop:968 length:651 start_codon:yes stop_codon:yes gene_type:complete